MKEKARVLALAFDREEERREILQKYRVLLRKIRESGRKNVDKKRVRKAFVFAAEAHKDMRRRSGEPYIYHPLEVACICVSELGLGTTSVISALLHDVVEDTTVTLAVIQAEFGEKVATIIEGLTKIAHAVQEADSSEQSQTFRKILRSLVKDVRVILVKIADRLHNMRTLISLPRYKQLRVVSETIYFYVPLAHRLGLHKIKSEMEDYYLKYTDLHVYRTIANKLKQTKRKREQIMQKLTKPIQALLQQEHIVGEVKGRTKSIYSIWCKIKNQHVPLEEVYDLYAIRIILDTQGDLREEKSLCWRVYALVTGIYTPNVNRIRDWISTPKGNGYEALHITVMAPHGEWVEVQIRSRRMDEIAEKGVAAHWRYKSKDEKGAGTIDQRILKIRDFIEHKGSVDSPEFVQDFHAEISMDEIYTFTPKGVCKNLPIGASVLDFAYEIHSDIGRQCTGAKVNKKLVPYSHVLQNGDQVHVITAPEQLPKEERLTCVVTSKAKEGIKQFLREKRKEFVQKGKKSLWKFFPGSEQKGTQVFEGVANFLYIGLDDLYYKVAKGIIKEEEIFRMINESTLDANRHKKRPKPSFIGAAQEKMLGQGTSSGVLYTISGCCHPIPGDEVFGIMLSAGEVKVHRTSCPNAPKLLSQHGKGIIKSVWTSQLNENTLSTVRMRGIDQHGITEKILNTVDKSLDITYVHLEAESGIFNGEIKVRAADADSLHQLMEKIKRVEGVITVLRTFA